MDHIFWLHQKYMDISKEEVHKFKILVFISIVLSLLKKLIYFLMSEDTFHYN